MKTAFTKPTRRFKVPGFSKRERLEVEVDEVEFPTKNLSVEFVKFDKIIAVLSAIIELVMLRTG